MTAYLEKFKDPRWQKKRLKILERDNFTCQECSNQEMTLHVHHRYYKTKTDPWDYPNEALITLCEECHEIERMVRPEKEKWLLDACKEKLLWNEVETLSIGIHYASVIEKESIDAIAWALENPELLIPLIKKHKTYIKKRLRGEK